MNANEFSPIDRLRIHVSLYLNGLLSEEQLSQRVSGIKATLPADHAAAPSIGELQRAIDELKAGRLGMIDFIGRLKTAAATPLSGNADYLPDAS